MQSRDKRKFKFFTYLDNQPEYIEYVEEECNGQQDEDTNDGFEEEYCTSETDTLKTFDFANSSDVPNIEISFPCDLCDKVFSKLNCFLHPSPM